MAESARGNFISRIKISPRDDAKTENMRKDFYKPQLKFLGWNAHI